MTRLRPTYDTRLQKVMIWRHTPDGRISLAAALTPDEGVELTELLQEVCNEACGAPDAQWAGDERIELGGPVVSSVEPVPEDCLPSIVRLADGEGHINLGFRQED